MSKWNVEKDCCIDCGWYDKDSRFCTYSDETMFRKESCANGMHIDDYKKKFYEEREVK